MTVARLITAGPFEQKSACLQLQEDIQAVLDRFVDEHAEMPCATVIGVLRIVEHEFIERF